VSLPRKHRNPDTRPGRGYAYGKVIAAVAAVPVVLVAVILIGLGQSRGNGPDPASATDFYRVEPISFDLTVSASGELEALSQVEVKSRVNGRPAIIEIVPEGTTVKQGEVLVRLDTDETTEKLEQAKLAEEQARAAMVNAEKTLAIETSEAESTQRAAEVKLSLARLDLAKWESGDVVQRRNELKLGIEKAKRRLERAKRDHELSKDLYAQNFISLNELEDAELEQINAADALETAKLESEVYETYEYVREKQAFESDVEQARAELERTVSKNLSKLEQLESDRDSKKHQHEIRVQSRVDLERQLASSTIVAPQDGLVVYASSTGSRWGRGDPIAEGRQVRFGESIVLLPDTRRMVATIRVHEALIAQIEPGQPANITIDARPDQVIPATVIAKAVTPDDGGWWNPNLREYKVRIELPEGLEGLKPAMRCTGVVQVGRVTDALAVPIQAVFAEGDQRFCYVPAGGRITRKPVEIGRASDTLVEITGGLKAGDRVLLRDPKPGEAEGS